MTLLNIYLAKVAQLSLVGKTIKLVKNVKSTVPTDTSIIFPLQQADNRQTSICIMKYGNIGKGNIAWIAVFKVWQPLRDNLSRCKKIEKKTGRFQNVKSFNCSIVYGTVVLLQKHLFPFSQKKEE